MDDLLVIMASGTVVGQARVDGPLTDVTIEISAADAQEWTATMDDLTVSATS